MIELFTAIGYINMLALFAGVPYLGFGILLQSNAFTFEPQDWLTIPKVKARMPESIEPDMDTVLSILAHRAHMEERGL